MENTINTTPKFSMTNFKHITEAGVAAYWNLMDSMGTIGMLWDISNQARIDALMLMKNFNMTKYILDQYSVEIGAAIFNEVMEELHDELVDARFSLEWAFVNNHNYIYCQGSDRTMNNLRSLEGSSVWTQETVYPQAYPTEFTCHADLEGYAIEETANRDFTVHVTATNELYNETQEFDFTISGANSCNTLGAIDDALRMHDYAKIVYTVK